MNAKPLPCLPGAIGGLLVLALSMAASADEASLAGPQGGWIGGVAFSHDGSLLAGGSSDGTASIWKMSSGKCTATFRGHADYVVSVAMSPDARLLATGSYDHTARLWDVATERVRHELKGHAGVVMSVAFSPDGATLATAGIDRNVMLWEVATGRRIATLEGHRSWVNAVAFTGDGGLLASGGSDGTVRLWDVQARKIKQVCIAGQSEVRSLAVSRDGLIAAGLRYGMVRVWEAENGQYKDRLHFKAHKADVFGIAISPDGKTLITGNGDWNQAGQVNLWRLPDGRQVGTFATTGEVLSLAASPDGRTIAAGTWDKKIHVGEWPSVPNDRTR
jgi:WD40 repeat protein